MSRAKAGLLTFFCLLAGCSGRDHTNPFDPLNPDTHGVPNAARALSGCDRVDLHWDSLDLDDLLGFRVWRAPQHPPGPFELLTPRDLSPDAAHFADTSARNDVVYRYRVEYLFSGLEGESAFAHPIMARPGRGLPWCADPCGWEPLLLAPDGGSVRGRSDAGGVILDLDVDPVDHRVFAAMIDSGLVAVWRSTGERIGAWPVEGASCVGWSASERALAVGAFYESRVSWLAADGASLFDLDLKGSHPEDVAFRDRSLTWVALYEGPLLRVDIRSARVDTVAIDLTRPVGLADDPGLGCWVADRAGAVAYVSDTGAFALNRDDFERPLDLDRDGASGCWIADSDRGAAVHVDRDVRVIEERAGMDAVAGVTLDPVANTLWLAMPERGKVRCLGLTNGWSQDLSLNGCPRKIAGDWMGGCTERQTAAD
jgi:hypothetical protein